MSVLPVGQQTTDLVISCQNLSFQSKNMWLQHPYPTNKLCLYSFIYLFIHFLLYFHKYLTWALTGLFVLLFFLFFISELKWDLSKYRNAKYA